MNRRAALGLAFDAVLVLVFALIGRASHEEDLTAVGVLTTLWPFLAALLLGWVVSRSWQTPERIVPSGLVVWAVTVAGGMVLRAASEQGVQLGFVVVTAVVLGMFLLGRRALARVLARRRG
ncbi:MULTISPECIES: DUF3054 domain-containing protein [unclassified Rathayibacter]|uniref:DUF3054 domain-containing protein n=1 Tax=unclassified Rathayibacter TaxID=2609250 RepID=UPI00188ACC24|nr:MULTISPECIES: DUF3054 domain-containing protein [unclassified Rathayibacter]MBF4462841.1 DUF3054 domain-containing protein [Rathayibacter sp. VKM Ac-2879]MBF4504255.1 DUF3054 domain-containing protein [Rathayibacter sp. VKM Ac-2878]